MTRQLLLKKPLSYLSIRTNGVVIPPYFGYELLVMSYEESIFASSS